MAAVEHRTLVADTVTTVTLTWANPETNWLGPQTKPMVAVGQAANPALVYFTTDGSTPTIGGANCYVLPAALCELRVPDETAGGTAVVKAISSGTPTIWVRGAQ